MPDTKAASLTKIVADFVEPGIEVFSDEHKSYWSLGRMGYDHQTVTHSVGQYVDGLAHTNGTESRWLMLRRGYHGVYHQMSFEHLQRYADEFSYGYNLRHLDAEK